MKMDERKCHEIKNSFILFVLFFLVKSIFAFETGEIHRAYVVWVDADTVKIKTGSGEANNKDWFIETEIS